MCFSPNARDFSSPSHPYRANLIDQYQTPLRPAENHLAPSYDFLSPHQKQIFTSLVNRIANAGIRGGVAKEIVHGSLGSRRAVECKSGLAGGAVASGAAVLLATTGLANVQQSSEILSRVERETKKIQSQAQANAKRKRRDTIVKIGCAAMLALAGALASSGSYLKAPKLQGIALILGSVATLSGLFHLGSCYFAKRDLEGIEN